MRLFTLLSVLALAAACAPQPAASTSAPAPTVTLASPSAAPTTPPPILTPGFLGVLYSDAVPQALREQVEAADIPFHASMRLDVAQPGDTGTRFRWVYALAAPFPTVRDGVTSDELRSLWTSGGIPLLMAESTRRAFTAQWGEPASGSVRSVAEDQLLDLAWKESAWAILPFESLDPKWKVLTVDGQSPIRKGFDLAKYPLVVDFTLHDSTNLQAPIPNLPAGNYDPSKLTTLIMTGVTALVRATAVTMELKGATYPGEKVRNLFREADLMHVSNEIPFFSTCPPPKPDATGPLVFCSSPKYMELLTDIGTDVIELTGNHFADYGPNAMYETLNIYRANGIPYFGGGENLQDALKPALFEVNGNKIAFIGCNKPDVNRFPTATEYRPGAAPCNFPYLQQKIAELKSQGYVVVSTFQWNESYDYNPSPQQRNDFRRMAEAGASIVSGSQAHYAQTMEFYNGAFIHYGLGNLFFDQMGDQNWMPPGIRRLFFDRYVIYDGKLVSIELITAMLEDYSRPRIMTEEERAAFLNEYFYYSGWTTVLAPTPTPTITPTLTPMSLPPQPETSTPLPTSTPTP
jgi:poly-gamma-glutamate synthesis protein (capsule biosynthesis protein)